MASFALGLTKTAVAGTVNIVKSAIDEETKLRVRVKDDLVFITGEFEMLQAFLSATGTGERSSKNQVVRTWVRQLRTLAFDVEDCVEFVVHLDRASRWDWFWRLASCVRVCTGRPPLPLDVAVADIRRLKARVEDIAVRNTRYNLFTSVDGGADDGSNQQQMLTVGTASLSSAAAAAATFQVLRKVWKDTGKLYEDVASSDLKKLIDCEGSELQVISLWGSPQGDAIGQLGWKAMVKEAYDDPGTCREFKNRAWVKPTHPFNPVEFLNTLLTYFKPHHHHHQDDVSKSLKKRKKDDVSDLMRLVSQHKYLIVLEQELSSIADWEAIRLCLADGNNGSRIIVSTSYLGIAIACTREPYQVGELRRFFGDQYLYVFLPNKGRGHRIGMGELSWQLRRSGVLCVFVDSDKIYDELFDSGGNVRVPAGVEFERCVEINARKISDIHVHLAELLCDYEQDYELREKIRVMSSEDKVKMSRDLLSKHNWLVCIVSLMNSRQWDLIKQHLLPESIRGCILVMTREKDVVKYCVDHGSRALNTKDFLKGDRGRNIEEDDKFKLGRLVGLGRDPIIIAFVPVISYWGIAGVGKSAMVRKRYLYQKEHPSSLGLIGWVDVPHPFNLADLCRRLLLDFYSDEVKEAVAIAMMEGQDPTQWCSKILHESKFFIVLDGLQSKHDWDLIKATLLSQPISGTSIVITREESIAIHCTESPDDIHNIKGLETHEALDLFRERGFQLPYHYEKEMLNRIISKCGGLPEIITAIAGEYRRGNREADIEVWGDVNADFIGILGRMPGLRGLFCWMQSYFDACSDELKPCIFYLSVFTADQRIRKRRLLRRWIAEGYPSGCGGGGTAAEEKAGKLFLDLLRLSILYEEKQTSTIKSCKVNGFFFEYIKSRPMEDNLVFSLEGSYSPSSRLTGQHLTISSSWDRDETVFNSIELSRLRSLTVFGAWKSFLVSEKMKLLRVLDLEGTNTSDSTCVTDDDLEEISKLLHRLKFLSLRGCQQITRLPDSLGNMRQLQTLDVRYTSIVELPPAITTKLHKLQYIRVGTSTDTCLILLERKTSTPPPPPSTPPPPSAPPPSTPPSTAPSTPPSTPPPPPSTPPPPPPAPQEDSNGVRSNFLRATAAEAASLVQLESARVTKACMRKANNLVKSSCNSWWKLKNQLDLRSRRRVAANGGGAEVGHAAAEGIGMLTDMHTLGVVNVARGKGASLFLKELKKLTQLRKLGLSGINRKNWSQLCDAISGNLHHLESLSLQLMLLEEDGSSFDFACFDDMAEPPKTLNRLKVLYSTTEGHAAGGAWIRPLWINQLNNLKMFDHDLSILSQEDIDALPNKLQSAVSISLRIKPIEEYLLFTRGQWRDFQHYDSLRIECSTTLPHSKVTFGDASKYDIQAISIHCCCSSSVGTSSGSLSSCNLKIDGLHELRYLKEVTVTGTYGEGLKRDLREQLVNHCHKPVVK